MDVLEALYPFKGHPLYPTACGKVLTEKRQSGANAALALADKIADAMTDSFLEKRLR